MSLCAFTSVCEEDSAWIFQYIVEAHRLNLPFIMNFDRCSKLTKSLVQSHKLCVASCCQDDSTREFRETDKQWLLDEAKCLGYEWAMAWDIDETYERDARAKFDDILSAETADLVDVRWLNLWGDKEHIRVDGAFLHGHRVKFYNLKGSRQWRYDNPITNGAKLMSGGAITVKRDIVCLHHGMMTPELRRMHKARWDRIYSTALRGDANPYGFWKNAIETEAEAVLERHEYV